MRTIAACLFATALWGQSDTKPIVVQIQPPRADPAAMKMPAIEDLIKANALLTAPLTQPLPNLPAPRPMPEPAQPAPPATASAPPLVRAPKGYKPAPEIPLDANAEKALKLAQDYMNRPTDPVQGKDGSVLYTFGAGQPTIVCAPGHLSTIELEPGEVINEKQLSDEARWDLIFTLVGRDQEARSLVMIRPHDPELDANLVVATNRRVYYLRVVSKAHDYMPRVSFLYPNASSEASWADYKQQQAERDEALKESQAKEKTAPVLQNFYCAPGADSGYRFKGPKMYWYPLSACDNGKDTTYITLPDAIRTMGAPIFVIRAPGHGDKTLRPANYDVQDTTLVIHRLFYRGALITGTGKTKRELQVISPRAN